MEKILKIIADNFPNGIRDDFIDTNRVLKIYSATHADENVSLDFIATVIRANGTKNGGRFYFISDAAAENIRQLITEILNAHALAYYSAIFERHAELFARLHIFSPDVLKKILREIDTEYFYFDEFCSASKASRIDYEVAKIFMTEQNPLSIENLQAKIPYVPADKIAAVLSNSRKYLPANSGRYIPISRLQFDTDEIRAAERQIISCIDAKGFASAEDFSLSSNFALNPEISEKDLFSTIYEKFFAASFTKRGRKLYRKGDDATDKKSGNFPKNLRKFIDEHDELSVKQLYDFAEKFDAEPYRALMIAHEKMTRVDKDHFVKDALIKFDAAGIDAALMPFVQGKIIPLSAVTSFTGFPPVGAYSWNLFLLESFLRKFSEKYVYAAPNVNSSNIGAIHPRAMKFKEYLDVQAAAVVQDKIPLEKSAVEEFLVEKGYRTNRIDKVTKRVISRAQELKDFT